MSEVRSYVNKAVAELTAWSMQLFIEGVFPAVGFSGEEFEPNKYRYQLKGQQIAGGWKTFVRTLVAFPGTFEIS